MYLALSSFRRHYSHLVLEFVNEFVDGFERGGDVVGGDAERGSLLAELFEIVSLIENDDVGLKFDAVRLASFRIQ